MKLFAVKILGSNACESYCSGLSTSGGLIRLAAYGDGRAVLRCEDGKAALFLSREDARAAGLAAHWNNQRFVVEPARGNRRATGRVVQIEGAWTSCQEATA